MPRGVKLGTRRGCYTRHSKPRLRKLARDILAGKIDAEAVAQAFESTDRMADLLIARHLRQGKEYAPERLAQALEGLANTPVKPRKPKPIPLRLAKAALRHLAKEHGGKGEPIHKALRVEYPYHEASVVRAYHRQLAKDYGPRGRGVMEKKLETLWPQRTQGRYPEVEEAIKQSLSGYGVPREIWRSLMRKELKKI